MRTMSEAREGTARHVWRAGVIAGLIGIAGALAGCSSSDDSAYANVDSLAGAAAPNEGVAAQDASKGSEAAAPAAERSIIITGSMYMTVDDPIATADRVTRIVQGAGGRIDGRSETAPAENSGGSATLTLRIPSNHLDAVVEDLRKLGTVDQFSTNSYDVTTQVTDLNAEISTLRASTARIEGLLAQAKDIADIITLENELDGRQARLEGLEAQQRGLDDQVSMSTIDLSLTTEPVVVVEEEGPHNFWDGLVSG